jgi:HEPN domain-containing protein
VNAKEDEMNPQAKSFILKAQDNLDLAKKLIDDEKQHDIVGYNLAQAVELYLKALCVFREIEFPHDEDQHDLDVLMQLLEEDNMTTISSHADVIELTPYNSTTAKVRQDERLDLEEWLGYVEALKELVGEVSM